MSALQGLTTVDEAKAASLARDPAVAADAALAYEASCFLGGGGNGSSSAWRGRCVKMEVEGVLGRGMGFLAEHYLPAKIGDAASVSAGTPRVAMEGARGEAVPEDSMADSDLLQSSEWEAGEGL